MAANGLVDTQWKPDRADFAVLAGCLVLTAWVQRHALTAFFSSPDDLVHLQQAVGLRPILPSPFRFLTQIVYFKLMMAVFGPAPGPFHLLSLCVHVLNVALVFLLVRLVGAPRGAAGLCAALFGTFPLFLSVLASAIGVNDEFALTFTLLALFFVRRGGTRSVIVTWTLFVVAFLCKESVLAMPLLALILAKGGERLRVGLALLNTAAVFAVLLLVAPPQGLGPYAVGFGFNVFHNLMTYAAWSMNLAQPLPDLVSSFDTSAWRVGTWVYGVLLAWWIVLRRDRPLLQLGGAWWLVGLLPVLPLRYQTYRHYLYPALPGMALATSSFVTSVLALPLRTLKRDDGLLRTGDVLTRPIHERAARTV